MKNYTRFPLAVLKWPKLGWTQEIKKRGIYQKPLSFLCLTAKGKRLLTKMRDHYDVRANDIEFLDENIKRAIALIGFYSLLDRAGFDTTVVDKTMENAFIESTHYLRGTRQVLFSPFQELSPDWLTRLFSYSDDYLNIDSFTHQQNFPNKTTPQILSHTEFSNQLGFVNTVNKQIVDDEVKQFFESVRNRFRTFEQTIEFIFDEFRSANKDEFYPFVTKMFRALGYDCDFSRTGVNYQRWDAFIIDEKHSIPIEIKSPGEEEFLSVKAIRQALENKVILLSRKSFPTQRKTTSLAVGYRLPNNRSDVVSLISDIYEAYDIIIGVIDFYSLLRLVGETVLHQKIHDKNRLVTLHGIINISDP